MGSFHERPQVSDESIAGPKCKTTSPSAAQEGQNTSSTSHDQTLKGLAPNLN